MLKPADIAAACADHPWRITDEDGRVTVPSGAGAPGFLPDTEDGAMNARIIAGNRKPVARPNTRDTTPRERADAFDGYFSDADRWRLIAGPAGPRAQHELTVALNSAFVGSRQWRDARPIGRRLILPDAARVSGDTRRDGLQWRRPPAWRSDRTRRLLSGAHRSSP
jgi:hypothetical protein